MSETITLSELLTRIGGHLLALRPRLSRQSARGRGVSLSPGETWALNGLLTILDLAVPADPSADPAGEPARAPAKPASRPSAARPGGEVIRRDGEFFPAADGPRATFRVRPAAGRYSRIEVAWRAAHGPAARGRWPLLWIGRDRHRDLFGFAQLVTRGPGRDGRYATRLRLLHGVGQSQVRGEKERPVERRADLHGAAVDCRYVYDAGRGIELRVGDHALEATPNVDEIAFDGRQELILSFGGDADEHEPPQTDGWRRGDLRVTLD